MTISLAKWKNTDFGAFLEPLSPTTVFVFDDDGEIWIDPEISECDGDVVVWHTPYTREERMGRAVALSCLTPAEALEVARRHRLHLTYNNRYFCWSQPTRRSLSQWCAGFRKQRGSRTHLIPVTFEQSLELIAGTKKITYWTNSRRCDIVAA